MDSAKKVALNTLFLYSRMLISIFISLYSTRIVLNALGVKDYGIFSLIAGVIGMLSFLNAAMASSTQRFYSFYLGAGDITMQKIIFNNSVRLHLIIGIAVVILFEIAGLFIFNGMLNIPEDRIQSAKIVYHFMVLSTFFTINAVPYDASIVTHEDMLLDSVIGVFESLLKLGIAIWVMFTQHDKLVLYGLLFAGLTILIRIIKSFYCFKYYPECSVKIKTYYNSDTFKEMYSFAAWNLFGPLGSVFRNQGLAVVLNIFHGVIANTAYGIANQVSGVMNMFSMNMMKAINPQIVKSEGGKDRKRMLRLAILSGKISFFMLSLFAVPLILEMHYILKIWLKTVPEYATIFCQLVLVSILLRQITQGLKTAINSVGDIKAFQSVVGSLIILNLPLAVLLMKLGLPAYSVFVGVIFIEILASIGRVYFAKKVAGLNAKEFLVTTILNSFIAVGLAILISGSVQFYLQEGFTRLIFTGLLSLFSIIVFGFYIAFSKDESKKIWELLISFYTSLNKRLKFK